MANSTDNGLNTSSQRECHLAESLSENSKWFQVDEEIFFNPEKMPISCCHMWLEEKVDHEDEFHSKACAEKGMNASSQFQARAEEGQRIVTEKSGNDSTSFAKQDQCEILSCSAIESMTSNNKFPTTYTSKTADSAECTLNSLTTPNFQRCPSPCSPQHVSITNKMSSSSSACIAGNADNSSDAQNLCKADTNLLVETGAQASCSSYVSFGCVNQEVIANPIVEELCIGQAHGKTSIDFYDLEPTVFVGDAGESQEYSEDAVTCHVSPRLTLNNLDKPVKDCDVVGSICSSKSQFEWQWLHVDSEVSLKYKSCLPDCCKPPSLRQNMQDNMCGVADIGEVSVPEREDTKVSSYTGALESDDYWSDEWPLLVSGLNEVEQNSSSSCTFILKCGSGSTERLPHPIQSQEHFASVAGEQENDSSFGGENYICSLSKSDEGNNFYQEMSENFDNTNENHSNLIQKEGLECQPNHVPFVKTEPQEDSYYEDVNKTASEERKTEPFCEEELAIYFPAVEKCSAMSDMFPDIVKRELDGHSSGTTSPQELFCIDNKGSNYNNSNNNLSLKIELSEHSVSPSVTSGRKASYGLPEIISSVECSGQDECQDSSRVEMSMSQNLEDSDVIVIEIPQQDPVCVTIDDSFCSPEENENPCVTERRVDPVDPQQDPVCFTINDSFCSLQDKETPFSTEIKTERRVLPVEISHHIPLRSVTDNSCCFPGETEEKPCETEIKNRRRVNEIQIPAEEPTCIRMYDSYCSTENSQKGPFSIETESLRGEDPATDSHSLSCQKENLPYQRAIRLLQETPVILAKSEAGMERKTKSKTPGSGAKGKGDTQSRPSSSSHSHKGKGHAQNNQQRPQQKIYEPYWSAEAVGEGIKRGELIVGPIRINPKNYEDAYIPLPDGKSDLFIGGMADRNRALNSDVVVVLPYPKDKWRVFLEDFEFYEMTHCGNGTTERTDSASKDIDDDDDDGDGDSDDSGPDVIFDTDSENEADAAISKKAQASSGTEGDQPNLEQAVAGLSISADAKMMTKISKVVNRINSKKQTPPTPNKNKKFSSVSEMAASGSPLARDLFGSGLTPEGEEKSMQFVQRTGKVVYIYERKHSRAASGRLKLMPDRSKNVALFSPSDSRIPRICIPMSECPEGFYQRPNDYTSTLYIARIKKWDEGMKMPQGALARSLGEAGQIEPETQAMLIEMDVDDSPFSEEVERCLPTDLPWSIPDSELDYRKDLRQSCIFTIDPATARDLDDALSIEEVGEGKFEVGVHIADVSYFVSEGTALDEVASQRATSCYLVQKVIPMLPRLLCEELCSLNPDHDRLAFSVIWVINEDGEIFSEWYGRSVIRSCVKLSYDHAQGFIDEPDKNWTRAELPPISDPFSVEDVKKRVLQLNKIALNLRKQRFDNGALRLDQVKLQYSLNSDTGLPNGYSIYQQKDSNRLIEEFMLLANMAVAHKITNSFPDKAVLRRHPPPQVKPLIQVEELCENLGLEVDAGTAGTLQKSLWKHYGDDEFSQARLQVLIVLISKPMQNAKYFCTGIYPDDSLYHHYALNVPLYTHFTSPIRRYPDVMVHRLLAASLGYCEPPERSPQLIHRQADYCNDKKLNAKMASERSSDMYFAIFVKEAGPLEETGMVMAVLDKSFDVLILKLGVVKRVYLERLPLRSHKFRKNHKCPELEIEWVADKKCERRTRHLISLFTLVDCYVAADKEPLRWSCVIKRPKEEIKFVTANE